MTWSGDFWYGCHLRDRGAPRWSHSREIYSASYWKCAADGLDSRVRGYDRCIDTDPIPNDTITGFFSYFPEASQEVQPGFNAEKIRSPETNSWRGWGLWRRPKSRVRRLR